MKVSPSTVRRARWQNERTDSWQHQIALFIVCIAVFLDALDTSIVNVALPSIEGDLHLSTLDLPWVPGAYFLTYGGFLLLGGRAADLLGRRRIFLIGTALFGVASLVCGLANSGWLLLVARGLQGIGAALTLPSAISIITTTFAEGPERNRALSIFSATGASGFSIGLVLGGILTTFINWHWVFFVNLPFALLILLFSRSFIRESRLTVAARSYDIAGAVAVTTGLLLLGYVITQANQPGATTLKTAGLLVLTLLILTLFILIERRSQAPLIPLRIFRSRTTCAANLASLMLLGPFFGFLFIAAIYLQSILHYSPVQASLALLPGSTTTVLVARWIAPQLVKRLGVRLSTMLSLLCVMSGIMLFVRIGPGSDYLGTILPPMLLVMGLGIGIGYPSLAIAAVSGIANAEQGLAAGLQGTSLQTGGGLWLTITAAVVAMNTGSTQGVISISAQLNGFHVGLLVAAAGTALGALIAYAGIVEPAPERTLTTQALIEDELPL